MMFQNMFPGDGEILLRSRLYIICGILVLIPNTICLVVFNSSKDFRQRFVFFTLLSVSDMVTEQLSASRNPRRLDKRNIVHYVRSRKTGPTADRQVPLRNDQLAVHDWLSVACVLAVRRPASSLFPLSPDSRTGSRSEQSQLVPEQMDVAPQVLPIIFGDFHLRGELSKA